MRGLGSGVGEEPWIAEGPLLGGFSSVAIGCLWVGSGQVALLIQGVQLSQECSNVLVFLLVRRQPHPFCFHIG